MNDFDIITILGATATGKTRLGVLLAHRLQGEIIGADSRQVYRGMDIGTGKDLSEYAVENQNIPYHLIDVAEPGTEYNVYSFQDDFLKVYQDIKARIKIPVLCGGTGLYLESVLSGYQMKKVPANASLRKSLAGKSPEELISILDSFGPLHNTTDTTDRERSIRAIEIKQFGKENRDAPPGMFAAEAAGLQALRATGTFRVPDTIAVGEAVADCPYLLLEYVESGAGTPPLLGHF